MEGRTNIKKITGIGGIYRQFELYKNNKEKIMNKHLKIMLTVSMLAGFLGGCVTGTKMGAPT
ncbi:MAG TPA: hypothetical protein DDY69_07690, partial [Deltaproteobacteria bacterium]|nr:hypothetical protein [Deltaproteobacteria bacterium]